MGPWGTAVMVGTACSRARHAPGRTEGHPALRHPHSSPINGRPGEACGSAPLRRQKAQNVSATPSQGVAKAAGGPPPMAHAPAPPAPPAGSRGKDLVPAPLHPLRQAITAQTEFLVPLLQQPPQASADTAQRRLPNEVADLEPQLCGQALGESCHWGLGIGALGREVHRRWTGRNAHGQTACGGECGA